MPQNNFSRILLAAIEEGLSSLGNSPREAIFYYLETSFQLRKEDIPLNLTDFKRALDRIFGPGAPYLERIITTRLYEKLGLDSGCVEGANLLICVNNAKKRMTTAAEVKSHA